MRNYLASIEGSLKDLLLKCNVTEANNLGVNDKEERQKKLLTLAITALTTLKEGGDPSSGAAKQTYHDSSVTKTPGAPSNALSLESDGLSAGQAAAVAALERRMGVAPR